ncbi:MAG: hypothetical protein IJS20_08595 [Bacteroidales bacterium]|nr:hypothetical protein [Bacteroidales bacterium]
MNKLEDLQTLMRLLKEFEFPVSPILEYAIKEKMEQLSHDEESLEELSIQVNYENSASDVFVRKPIGTRKKSSVLRVTRSDGSVIESETAANTLSQTIKEIGIDKVCALQIQLDGMNLVTKGGNPLYPTSQHEIENGYFVNVHSNTISKKRQLERILNAYNPTWKVEIVEPNSYE